MILTVLAIAALQPGPPVEAARINPAAADLFDRDPVLKNWALSTHDRNRDGWLTLYEAQSAALAFKGMADVDRNGRVTVSEYETAKARISVRHSASASQ